MVIGIDCHKATLAACAVDALGAEMSAAEFRNTAAGHVELLGWARALGGVSRIGIEGSGFYGHALAHILVSAGESVVEVPARLTQRERGRLRRPGKSDAGDALAISRVAAREVHLPPAGRDNVGHELRQLLGYREQLVKERTPVANRLHADLMARHPGYQDAVKNLVSRRWLRAAEALIGADATVAGTLARRRLGKLMSLGEEIAELSRLVVDRVERTRSGLTRIPGVGALVAGRILAEVGDVRRFRSAAHFAAANGTAPVPASSGQVERHRLNRGGNRRLNRALHTVALVQARSDRRARAYVAKRRAEGKTQREAIRSLKRHLSNVVYRQLVADAEGATTSANARAGASDRRTGAIGDRSTRLLSHVTTRSIELTQCAAGRWHVARWRSSQTCLSSGCSRRLADLALPEHAPRWHPMPAAILRVQSAWHRT